MEKVRRKICATYHSYTWIHNISYFDKRIYCGSWFKKKQEGVWRYATVYSYNLNDHKMNNDMAQQTTQQQQKYI